MTFDDTRRDRSLSLGEEMRKELVEIGDEGPRDPHDRINLMRAIKFLDATLQAVRATGDGRFLEQCSAYMATGGRCDLTEGHAGDHQKQYPTRLATWSDESQRDFIRKHASRFD